MHSFNPNAYGPVFGPLVAGNRRRPLDAGQPDRALREELDRVSIASAFEHGQVVDEHMAACCLAGLWLLHDFLDESHAISQAIETPSGSFWHAIMHRREGDFGNAKYWFRRVGEHPAFEAIAEQASLPAWDPFTFVDRCQAAVCGNPVGQTFLSATQAGMPAPLARERCLEIQQIEWEALFDDCYRAALGVD